MESGHSKKKLFSSLQYFDPLGLFVKVSRRKRVVAPISFDVQMKNGITLLHHFSAVSFASVHGYQTHGSVGGYTNCHHRRLMRRSQRSGAIKRKKTCHHGFLSILSTLYLPKNTKIHKPFYQRAVAGRSFHILHIRDRITEAFSFNDLLTCILVNRHWHEASFLRCGQIT